jgi:transcriptional regulator
MPQQWSMYVPAHFAETDPEKLAAVIGDYNFGILVSAGPQGLFATHLPFVPDPARPRELLHAHMARANPHWRDLAENGEALAIFQGPHAYVSAAWYATRPKVPTWNYIALHVYGRVRLRNEPQEILETLALTVRHQEAGRAEPWRMEDQPEQFLTGMARGVVALELAVTRIEGKFKLSQNRSREDQRRVVEHLGTSTDPVDRALGELSQHHLGLYGPASASTHRANGAC